MELDNLPAIDWELSMKLAGNKKELAKDILDLFMKTIADDLVAIQQTYAAQNYSELLKQVHKLHGATCYCGLPRLKTIIARLETDLKNNIMVSLPSLLNQLDTEVNFLLDHYSSLPT